MQLNYPKSVDIVEVGARDGLQNENQILTAQDKINFIDELSECGFSQIEAGSFVSAKWVPQMANSDQVLLGIKRKIGITYSALTPNTQGYFNAIRANADCVAVFASASEAFSLKNINCDIATSIERFDSILKQAAVDKIPVRGYVSCVLGCPYEGEVSPDSVLSVAQKLLELGCYQVSLGDTIGVGTANKMNNLLNLLVSRLPVEKLALHCHDTYGQALTNVLVGLQQGISTYDSSVAGLGGCPYAKGASGNLATEDLVYMLANMGIETGIDLNRLVKVGHRMSKKLQRQNQSKVANAIMARTQN